MHTPEPHILDNPHIDVFAKAQVVMNKINAEAGWPLLVMRRQQPDRAGGVLTVAELEAFADVTPGWFDVRSLFLAIRLADPSKGESIRTGQQMGAQGWARRKSGAVTLWHMDNTTRARVG